MTTFAELESAAPPVGTFFRERLRTSGLSFMGAPGGSHLF